jgi:hypothetical protein
MDGPEIHVLNSAQDGSSHIASMLFAQLDTNRMSLGPSPKDCQAT